MTRAAGILFVSKTDPRKALFLQRGSGGDFPGQWCFPGGTTEGDETPEQTAVREAKEELGSFPKGERRLLARTVVNRPAALPSAAAVSADGPAPDTSPVAAAETILFTTFMQEVAEPFEPKLDGEHVGHAWAPLDAPPQPLHPGCAAAIARLGMDELGVAKAIRDGTLASPQQYENIALFAIRITGTGVAYRSQLDEHVWRDSAHYLNDEFLQRCNGLPVIMEHPKRAILDSKEFTDRIIGTVMLPYVSGSEVWGIAKIYDASAAKMMEDRQLSTSPGVSWRDFTTNLVLKRDDGSTLLIEGKPSLLDHIAVCELGVWDKGGEASGVLNQTRKDTTAMPMTPEEIEAALKQVRVDSEARATADADNGTKLDKLLTHLDSMHTKMDAVCGRMDAFEEKEKSRDDARRFDARKDAFSKRKDEESDEDFKKRHDAEETEETSRMEKEGAAKEVAADKAKKARKDAEEEDDKERKAKADSKRKDDEEKEKEKGRTDSAAVSALRDELAAVKKMLPRQMSDDDHAAMSAAQARADSVFTGFGKSASAPMQAETLQAYRLRMARDLKVHSLKWKDVNLDVVAIDSAAFDAIEADIYEAARLAARNPTDLVGGAERAITRTDSGRPITEFVGNDSFVRAFTLPPRSVTQIGPRLQ